MGNDAGAADDGRGDERRRMRWGKRVGYAYSGYDAGDLYGDDHRDQRFDDGYYYDHGGCTVVLWTKGRRSVSAALFVLT